MEMGNRVFTISSLSFCYRGHSETNGVWRMIRGLQHQLNAQFGARFVLGGGLTLHTQVLGQHLGGANLTVGNPAI